MKKSLDTLSPLLLLTLCMSIVAITFEQMLLQACKQNSPQCMGDIPQQELIILQYWLLSSLPYVSGTQLHFYLL